MNETKRERETGPRIAIAGAGIGGLTAAIALTQMGFEVEVFERCKTLRAEGSGITVQTNAMLVMQRLEVADEIVRQGEVLKSGGIFDSRGRTLQKMDMSGVHERFGAPSVAIHRERLITILDAAYKGPRTFGQAVVGFGQRAGAVDVRLGDDSTKTFDALIGCDGLHSSVRRALHGDESARYSGYTTWRGVCSREIETRGATGEYWGAGARFGVVPIGHGETYWFAVKNCEAGGEDASDPRGDLLATFGDWPAPVAELIESTGPDVIIRTDVWDRAPMAQWGTGRVTLLGDAAHPMTPNLGQGAGQAIEDGFVLARELAMRRDDLGTGLRAYESARAERAKWFVDQSWKLGRLAQWESKLATRVRNWLVGCAPASLSDRQLQRMYGIELTQHDYRRA